MHWRYSFIKTALFVEGEGDWIIAYRERVFKLFAHTDDPLSLKTARRAARFLGIRPAPTDIWDFISTIRDTRPDILLARHDGNRIIVESGGDYAHRTGSRLLQNVMKELGYEQVAYTNSEGEEYETHWDSQVQGDLPKFLYHGTTSEHANDILRLGLRPGEAETNYPARYTHGPIQHDETVFLTEDIAKAEYHAMNAVNRDLRPYHGGTHGRPRGFPVIFRLEIPDPNLLVPDYDIENASTQPTGTYEGVYRAKRRKWDQKVKEPAFDMSKKVGVFGYRGRIPASFIRQILIKTNTDETSTFDQANWTETTPAQLQQAIEYGEPEAAFYEPEEEEEVCPKCGWTLNDSGHCNCPDNLPPGERQASYRYQF